MGLKSVPWLIWDTVLCACKGRVCECNKILVVLKRKYYNDHRSWYNMLEIFINTRQLQLCAEFPLSNPLSKKCQAFGVFEAGCHAVQQSTHGFIHSWCSIGTLGLLKHIRKNRITCFSTCKWIKDKTWERQCWLGKGALQLEWENESILTVITPYTLKLQYVRRIQNKWFMQFGHIWKYNLSMFMKWGKSTGWAFNKWAINDSHISQLLLEAVQSVSP